MEYESVIGLEVHSELSTKTKIYCGCSNEFGGDVNTHCCPICMGMPGTLPVLNEKVVEYAIKAGLALNCEISLFSKQDRKHYFYPDLPKAYQTSQFDMPLCKNGYVDIEVDGKIKRIGIIRIHIEEDAGKLLHGAWGNGTLVDMNRCGVPLIEIVTAPDMRSSEEAKALLEKIKTFLQYIDVSDCKMQEGSLRCDVNVSIMPKGSSEFGTRTEMKNLNTFSGTARAIDTEIARQIEVVEAGGKIEQETRRWDDAVGESYAMRSKEEAHDYRYFPEPDLAPIVVTPEYVEELRASLPEMPDKKMARYISEFNLPEYDANLITSSKPMAEFFDETVKYNVLPKYVGNWLMGDISRILREREMEFTDMKITPERLAQMIDLIDKGVISNTAAKQVLETMFEEDKEPKLIIEEQGLAQISDESELIKIVQAVVDENPKSIEDYKNGKSNAFKYLVGQTMKATKGKANPQLINDILKEILESI